MKRETENNQIIFIIIIIVLVVMFLPLFAGFKDGRKCLNYPQTKETGIIFNQTNDDDVEILNENDDDDHHQWMSVYSYKLS